MRHHHPTRSAGFTLTELLIVVAIVTVLASILFAVFQRVREKGRSATCQSNLKQIALALQQYVQDSDGRYPAMMVVVNRDTPTTKVVYWNDAIMPYVKVDTIFQCPSSEIRGRSGDVYGYNWGQLNDRVWSPDRDPRRNQLAGSHESKPLLAATVPMNHDVSAFSGEGSTLNTMNGSFIETSCGSHIVPNLHSGGANYSFVDGHVKWLSQAQQGEMLCAYQRSGTHE